MTTGLMWEASPVPTVRSWLRRFTARAQALRPGSPSHPPRRPARLDLGISDAELVRRYQAGESIRQLAAVLGTRYNVIYDRLITEGAQLRTPGQPSAH